MKKGAVGMPELLEHFGISLNTLRRDIDVLCRRGSVSKVYGGIVYNKESNVEPFVQRSSLNVDEKMKIGKLASSFIEDNDTIYIDSGTTTVNILQHIRPDMNITIICNSLNLFVEASKYPYLNLIAPGGIFYHKTHSFVGMASIAALQDYHLSKSFMAASGISLDMGASTNSFHEADIKKAVIARSEKVILMTDHSKINRPAGIHIVSLTGLYAFVTDKKPPNEYMELFNTHHVQCLYQHAEEEK
ncbi:MAG: DeoR/GlpR family DNA-binding transcription regulator [Oscillospiraceae bacterium]|nr:DeoR/GlpR family DNA-binding transcription regulator [Oscillospiraceae bacterium]